MISRGCIEAVWEPWKQKLWNVKMSKVKSKKNLESNSDKIKYYTGRSILRRDHKMNEP